MGLNPHGVRACRRLPDGTAIYTVGDRDPTVRLDLFLKERIPKLSRARIQQAIGRRVEVAGRAALKPATLLRPGDTVIVHPVPAPREEEPDIIVPVLFRDDELLVIDKPAGLLAHPSNHVRKASVTHMLETSGPVHLVHRLDRETSGVMVIARSAAVARALSAQLARATQGVEKLYLAVVFGEMRPRQGTIDLPIGKAVRSAVYVKRGVNEMQGRPSRTEFTLLARGGGFSLLELRTFTGRRHQIRVHLAAFGHPVVGDKLYGPAESHYLRFIKRGFDERMKRELLTERQMLHAWRLRFLHPRGGRPIEVSAPPPPDMRAFLRGCGLGEAAGKLVDGGRTARDRTRAGGGLCRSSAGPGHRPTTSSGLPAVAQAAGDPEA